MRLVSVKHDFLEFPNQEAPVQLQTAISVTGPRADESWKLYELAFDELRTTAVQRHLMSRAEFDGVLLDERVTKYFGVDDDGGYVVLATVATDLTAMPLVSPEYFAHRWPDRYAAGQIWYVGFVAVRPDHQRGPLFGQIVRDIGRAAAAVGGVTVMDVSRAVSTRKRMPEALDRFFSRLAPGTRSIRLDEQTYWAYEFPAADAAAATPSSARGPGR